MYIVCIDVYKGGGIFKKTLRKLQKEKYVYIYVHTHTALYVYSYTHPVKRKTLHIMLRMSHKTKKSRLFQAETHVGVHLSRVQKKAKDPGGFTSLQFATRDPSFMINFTYLTGRLQFLNSTPQHDERTTLSAASLGLLEDR